MNLKPSKIILAYCVGVIISTIVKIDITSAVGVCVFLMIVDVGLNNCLFKENK